ncbi:hypothetical protein [Kingella sp. (in: b-proteobacteria)]|nr:hypothetical protein [Kingella sp. (in: b-proteobacteria)]MDO4658534.1 hypothetical protein [Kingella sp. (in: b-proteobacteria)]
MPSSFLLDRLAFRLPICEWLFTGQRCCYAQTSRQPEKEIL